MKTYPVYEPEFGDDLLAALRRPKNDGVLREAAADAANEIERLRAALTQISGMRREDLYLSDSELPIDNAAAWLARNTLSESNK